MAHVHDVTQFVGGSGTSRRHRAALVLSHAHSRAAARGAGEGYSNCGASQVNVTRWIS